MRARSEELNGLLRGLKLSTMAETYAPLAVRAAREGLTHEQYLYELAIQERQARDQRRIERLLLQSFLPREKTFETLDLTCFPPLARQQIERLRKGHFLDEATNVVALGNPGTGKPHLATALGVEAARQGHLVRFTTAGRLVTELTEARDARELGRVVARYERIDLLVLDELAYLPLSQIDAELLFRVLGERHERRSIIVTTNLPFAEWTSIFPDPRLCRAVVDRLTHRAHIIDTGKKSIRFTETLERNNRRKEKTRDQTES